MTIYIRDIEALLSLCDPEAKVAYGFKEPHSWRGIYAEAAVEPAANRTVGEMMEDINALLTQTFEGYKGGDYEYNGYTEIHLSEEGRAYEHDWGAVLASLARCIADRQRALQDPV